MFMFIHRAMRSFTKLYKSKNYEELAEGSLTLFSQSQQQLATLLFRLSP